MARAKIASLRAVERCESEYISEDRDVAGVLTEMQEGGSKRYCVSSGEGGISGLAGWQADDGGGLGDVVR